jgi:hypothetical protein
MKRQGKVGPVSEYYTQAEILSTNWVDIVLKFSLQFCISGQSSLEVCGCRMFFVVKG